MAKKQFKSESKKLMNLMINSIYTNSEIFLRELISNASDAIDKLYYKSLTDDSIKIDKKDLAITISRDEEKRILTISDNGIGMSAEELESDLGTIAKSDSENFKNDNEHKKDIDIIGQFGVGFYSAFMVAKNIKVISKKYGSKDAYMWESSGVDGYTVTKADKDSYGTDVILTLKDDTDDATYSDYLHEYELNNLIKKYSNYITYPIKMEVTKHQPKEGTKDEYEDIKEMETINDMVPIWKRSKVSDDEYNTFYKDKFNDYNNPLKVIKMSAEGQVSFKALLFIPSKAPMDFYTKEYEKGLQLYSNGVLIMDKCSDLLPDYYSFVKGVVDSEDLSLNISRETLQQDKRVKLIAQNIENKIHKELTNMLNEDRSNYEKFFDEFGIQIKYGVYDSWGINKEKLQDLLLFYSSKDRKYTTLKEYVDRKKEDQKKIYYACGETLDKVDNLPSVEEYKDKDIEVLYCTNYMDEFVMQTLHSYSDLDIINIGSDQADLSTEEEKKELEKKNNDNKSLLDNMKNYIKDVSEVKFTNKLKNSPVSLSSTGSVTIEMEKVINAMPTDQNISAVKVLEINENHPIANYLIDLEKNKNTKELERISKILYEEARLIEGLPIENPNELTNLICDEIAK